MFLNCFPAVRAVGHANTWSPGHAHVARVLDIRLGQTRPRPRAGLGELQRLRAGLARALRNPVPRIEVLRAATSSLFRRLVLGWIDADFRVQIRILQHFSSSTRISSSRKQTCKDSAKISRILQKSKRLLQNFRKFAKSCKILQICRIFY